MLSKASFVVASAALVFTVHAEAQSPRGASEASIGGQAVSVEYGRPSLKGRDMLGRAPAGTVWRTGADKSTTFTTAADITAGGKTIPAGSYSLFTKRVDGDTWHLIFNKQTGQWGTNHDASQDAAEVPLSWEESETSVDEFTMKLFEASEGGELQMLWGTHVLSLAFQVK